MIEIGEIIRTTENEMENIMIECDVEEDEVHLSALDEVVGGENEPENCVLGTEEPSLQSTALSALDEVVGEVVGGENEPENCVLGTEDPSLQSTVVSRLASIDFNFVQMTLMKKKEF